MGVGLLESKMGKSKHQWQPFTCAILNKMWFVHGDEYWIYDILGPSIFLQESGLCGQWFPMPCGMYEWMFDCL